MSNNTQPWTVDQYLALFSIILLCLYGLSRLTAWLSYRRLQRMQSDGYSNPSLIQHMPSNPSVQLASIRKIPASCTVNNRAIAPIQQISQPALLRMIGIIPHILIYGPTGSGKTTVAKAIAALIASRSDSKILVIDPDAKPGAWGNLAVITTTDDDNFDPIRIAVKSLIREMRIRVRAYKQGNEQSVNWLTVIWDELPACVDEIPEAGRALKILAQRSRKYKIKLIILSQSDRVKSMGLDGYGDTRDNFTYIRLARSSTPSGSIYQAALIQKDGPTREMDTSWIAHAAMTIPADRSFVFPAASIDTADDDPSAELAVPILGNGLVSQSTSFQQARLKAIGKALQAGLSGNDIYCLIGGNRAAALDLVDLVRKEQQQQLQKTAER